PRGRGDNCPRWIKGRPVDFLTMAKRLSDGHARVSVPKPGGMVPGGGHDALSIRAELGVIDGALVRQFERRSLAVNPPHPRHAVLSSRNESAAVGAKSHAPQRRNFWCPSRLGRSPSPKGGQARETRLMVGGPDIPQKRVANLQAR